MYHMYLMKQVSIDMTLDEKLPNSDRTIFRGRKLKIFLAYITQYQKILEQTVYTTSKLLFSQIIDNILCFQII